MAGMARERSNISRSPRGLDRCSADWSMLAERRILFIIQFYDEMCMVYEI